MKKRLSSPIIFAVSRVETRKKLWNARIINVMSPPSESTIQALAAACTPSLQGDAGRLRRIYSNFLYVFGDLPAATRTKLSLLVRIIEGASWVRYGRAVSDLSPERREALCRAISEAPIARLQAGFSGLRSLLFNATYTEPVMWDDIGYAGPTVGRGKGVEGERKVEG